MSSCFTADQLSLICPLTAIFVRRPEAANLQSLPTCAPFARLTKRQEFIAEMRKQCQAAIDYQLISTSTPLDQAWRVT
jgi:hypothetical protein